MTTKSAWLGMAAKSSRPFAMASRRPAKPIDRTSGSPSRHTAAAGHRCPRMDPSIFPARLRNSCFARSLSHLQLGRADWDGEKRNASQAQQGKDVKGYACHRAAANQLRVRGRGTCAGSAAPQLLGRSGPRITAPRIELLNGSMTNLFEAAGLEKGAPRPLADRLRPKTLAEVVGQDHLVGPEGTLTRMLQIGPPAEPHPVGAARLRQDHDRAPACRRDQARVRAAVGDLFRRAELRKAFDRAKIAREQGKGTLLFIDEIHRFNRSQQDSFLPYMEDGTITLVGATTENPSFELNAAVLSRADRADAQPARRRGARRSARAGRSRRWARTLPLDDDAREALEGMADGDGRTHDQSRRRGVRRACPPAASRSTARR